MIRPSAGILPVIRSAEVSAFSRGGAYAVVQMNSCVCVLCGSRGVRPFWQDRGRTYLQCPSCELVFVPEGERLAAEDEKRVYDLHQNSPDDTGYRKFLSRLFRPMNERITPESFGLDFGSGPGPTLSRMFTEAGHHMDIYDCFYAPDLSLFERRYDFITASEVVEHLYRPLNELDRLWDCLRPGGHLGIMTKLVIDRQAFARWHYKDDATHVALFSRATFLWLKNRWRAALDFIGSDVMIFEKGPES